MSPAQCESGSVLGVACEGSASAVVEYMPAQHRPSHTAARNRGVYPHNGALRLRVCEVCADAMCECEPDWCERVATPDAARDGFDEGHPHHVSFTPIDVGFDPRVHDTAIELPADVEAVRYTDSEGATRFARGTREALANVLRDAGYTVTP